MNKYQKKINKLTREQVNKDIEEIYPTDGISISDILIGTYDIGKMLYKIDKAFQITIMQGKSYYNKTRRIVRKINKNLEFQ